PAAASAEDGYVRVTIKGTNVNLRPQPRAGGNVVAKVNTGDVFIAETWPVTDVNDGSKWYRIVFRPDPKDGIVPFVNTFSYYDAEMEADVSPAEAFVSAQFANVTPLAAGGMKQIMETPRGGGFSALDTSAENQRRMALDKGVFNADNLFPEGSEGKKYAVYSEPSTNSGKKKYPLTEENEYFGAMYVTDKSIPGWLQIIGDKTWFSSGWIEAEPGFLQVEDFSLGHFMALCLGANVPEIMRKWGPGVITARDNSALEESYWHGVTDTTKMSFDGLEVNFFMDTRNFEFTLTRRGAGMGGIFIGEAWCDKDYLKRVFAHFPPEKIQAGKSDDGAESWRLELGRDGWFYGYEITFGSDGLVSELHFYCRDANLMY
ncbi:MAG: hypothetical protein FWF87_06765, partial [Synergistaceae bacterium]|nr:hypothetical protein [Synergistaceae bacterium]